MIDMSLQKLPSLVFSESNRGRLRVSRYERIVTPHKIHEFCIGEMVLAAKFMGSPNFWIPPNFCQFQHPADSPWSFPHQLPTRNWLQDWRAISIYLDQLNGLEEIEDVPPWLKTSAHETRETRGVETVDGETRPSESDGLGSFSFKVLRKNGEHEACRRFSVCDIPDAPSTPPTAVHDLCLVRSHRLDWPGVNHGRIFFLDGSTCVVLSDQ